MVGDPAVGDTEVTDMGAADDGDTNGDMLGDSVHPSATTSTYGFPMRRRFYVLLVIVVAQQGSLDWFTRSLIYSHLCLFLVHLST